MDDKTKVQLCRELIHDFWLAHDGSAEELDVILGAVQTVLESEEENDAAD